MHKIHTKIANMSSKLQLCILPLTTILFLHSADSVNLSCPAVAQLTPRGVAHVNVILISELQPVA